MAKRTKNENQNQSSPPPGFARAHASIRLQSYRDGLKGVDKRYLPLVKDKYNKWVDQGMRLPSHTPRIEHKGNYKGNPVFGCRIGLFYRAYAVVVNQTAYWYFIGPHPGRLIPMPSITFTDDP